MENKAVKRISGAILGFDGDIVFVGGRRYIIQPPTIHRIAGAAYYLSDMGDGKSYKEVIMSINDSEKLAKALSWFIKGDTSLCESLMQGTFEEIVNALETAYSMISAHSFMKLSALARSIASLTAKAQ